MVGSVVCVKFAPASIAATGKDDPREIVADEFAGQAVTFSTIPFLLINTFSAGQIFIVSVVGIFIVSAAGFLIFRLLDIIKPWPCRTLEKLPKGWGVLADDLLAGVYAAIALQIGIRLWISGQVGWLLL